MLKISIITVTLNAKEELEKTIQSVEKQEMKDYEYIIVDGGSVDGTDVLVRAYQEKNERIKFFSESDSGIYNAMNKGSLLANGKYTLFLGAGDVFYDKNVLKVIVEKNGADVIYGYGIFSSGPLCGKRIGCKLTLLNIFLDKVVAHQSVYIRTDLLKKYRFNEKYRVQADQDLLIRLYKDKYKFSYLNTALCYYDGLGFSSKEDVLKRTKMDRLKILKENYPILFQIRQCGHFILTGKKFRW